MSAYAYAGVSGEAKERVLSLGADSVKILWQVSPECVSDRDVSDPSVPDSDKLLHFYSCRYG